MRFYGGLSPAAWNRLDDVDRQSLLYWMPRIKARELYDQFMNEQAVRSTGDSRAEYLKHLAIEAFGHDPDQLVHVLEAVTRGN